MLLVIFHNQSILGVTLPPCLRNEKFAFAYVVRGEKDQHIPYQKALLAAPPPPNILCYFIHKQSDSGM